MTIGSNSRAATARATATASTTHTFRYTVVAADKDSDGLSVAAAAVFSNPGRIANAAGNAMTATALPDTLNSNQSSHKVGDITAPTLTGLAFSSSGPYGRGDAILLQATFSEAVTISSGTAASIPLTIGSTTRAATAAVTATASTTQIFSYTVVAADSDSDGIAVAAAAVISNPGRINDTAANAMTATALPDNLSSAQSSHTVDGSATNDITVTALAFTSSGPYQATDVITLQATFNKSVRISSGAAPSIPLTIGSTTRNATAAVAATAAARHNFTYTVVAADTDTDGIQVLSNAVISNTAQLEAPGSLYIIDTALPDTLNSHQSDHKVDNTKPTIASIAFASSGPYGVHDDILLQVTFSEAITISSGTAAAIPLTIGSNSRSATATATATASSSHNFRYTVVAADSDTNGLSVAAAAVVSNPRKISDVAGNVMTATAVPDSLSSDQSGHTVDGSQNTPPTVTGLALSSGGGTYKPGDAITVAVTFSKKVTIGSNSSASIPLTIGSTTRAAVAAATTTASASHHFSYTVVNGDSDTDGIPGINGGGACQPRYYCRCSRYRDDRHRAARHVKQCPERP